MSNIKIVTTTITLNEALADHFGYCVETYSFKQYGHFSEKVIREKYEFWYAKYDAIASEAPETLGMTDDEWSDAIDRTSRMADAWHKRLVKYKL